MIEVVQDAFKAVPGAARQILEDARTHGTHPAVTAMACALALAATSVSLGVSKEIAFGMIEEMWDMAQQEAHGLRTQPEEAS